MADDDLTLIVGGRAIAEALKIRPDQFTESRRKGGLRFVWKEPGLGLVTTRRAARTYLDDRVKAANSMASAPLDKAG